MKKSFDMRSFFQAFGLTTLVFSMLMMTTQAYAGNVTLTVAVQTSLTFNVSHTNFPSLTPGTAQYATSTLSVLTNDSSGWLVTLSGDNKSTGNNNLQLAANAASIPDQTEWVPNAATTSAGNAVAQASFTNSGNVLAYRVMTASSSNGTPFLASSWWGTVDGWPGVGTTLWAGIASSTVSRQIGNAGAGSYSSIAHLNTVQYYLNVATTQQTGTYNAPITYTATGN